MGSHGGGVGGVPWRWGPTGCSLRERCMAAPRCDWPWPSCAVNDSRSASTSRSKADPELKDIPIIALTAHALETDRQKALDAGADDFDTKPVDIQRLLDKIGKFT